jgi:hypothetical protein
MQTIFDHELQWWMGASCRQSVVGSSKHHLHGSFLNPSTTASSQTASVTSLHLTFRIGKYGVWIYRGCIYGECRYYTAKNDQVVAIVDENRIEQCFAVHSCQQCWTISLHPIQAQQYCWQVWTTWAAKHCSILLNSRLINFMRVNDNGHLLNTILDVTSFQTP